MILRTGSGKYIHVCLSLSFGSPLALYVHISTVYCIISLLKVYFLCISDLSRGRLWAGIMPIRMYLKKRITVSRVFKANDTTLI